MDSKEYLLNHGLDEEFVTKRLGWKLHPDKIEIPVFNLEGKKAYTRYRMFTGEHKFLTEKGAKLNQLYRIAQAAKAETIIFCEGEPDCAKLWQEGFPATTFPSGVKSLTSTSTPEGQARVNEIVAPLFGKTIYLCLDNDEAGQSTVQKFAKILRSINCQVHIVTLPKQYKDVCDYFVGGQTKDDFTQIINTSPTYEQTILAKYSQQYPILDNQTFHTTTYPPAKWLIDKLIRIGGISFLVGESGTGKTIASLSIAKAVSEGSSWLDKYPSTQMKVLIVDKENTPADIQKLYKTMGIRNDNIFNFFTEDDYQLVGEDNKPTEIADYLSLFVKTNNIGLVILDSAIDFLIGDENSSGDVATNINHWRNIFAPASILTIHHDSKQDPRYKKKSADRMRGSGVWLSSAQSVLSFSVISPANPEELLVEHAKVRGGAKSKPFQIKMMVRPDPVKPEETIVDGYKYIREVNEVKLKMEETKKAIIEFLTDHPTEGFSSKEIIDNLRGVIDNPRNISTALPILTSDGDIEKGGSGKRGDAFVYKICVSNMSEKLIKSLEKK